MRIAFELPSKRTVQAYQALFSGNGSREDAAYVLDDLEAFAGLWAVTTADTPNDQVKFAEGQRSVLGRIQALTRVTEPTVDLVEKARQPEDEFE